MQSNTIQHPAEWAISRLTQLGYVLTGDLRPLGAFVETSGVLVFAFEMAGVTPSGEPWAKKIYRRVDDLGSILHQVEDVNRRHPWFDLEQMALTDPASYQQLMAERRRARREALNDGPSFLDGRMRCTLCKWHGQHMVRGGTHPAYHHYCNHVGTRAEGLDGWLGWDDMTPPWCPVKGNS